VNRHVIGLFYDPSDAQEAIGALTDAGVARGEISMLATREAGHFALVESTKVAEGVAAGGAIGGAVGLGATLIAVGGAAGGVLAIGPLLIALAGLGFGTSVGGIVGALVGIGLPEHEARFYEDEVVERGAALVGVATLRHDDAHIATILHRHKAANITRPA
jgi:hypothetical protein